MTKITTIFKLREMLEEAKIPFGFRETPEAGGYQIEYPSPDHRVCSVIQNNFSYGNSADLLEIMGLLTKAEAEENEVCGWLTAEDVFARIETHWRGLDPNSNIS